MQFATYKYKILNSTVIYYRILVIHNLKKYLPGYINHLIWPQQVYIVTMQMSYVYFISRKQLDKSITPGITNTVICNTVSLLRHSILTE